MSGAACENITPVMSIRVDGPGASRISKFSTNSADTICIGVAMDVEVRQARAIGRLFDWAVPREPVRLAVRRSTSKENHGH